MRNELGKFGHFILLFIAACLPSHSAESPGLSSQKLYGAVSHSDSLPHVKQTLDKHKQVVQIPLKAETPLMDDSDSNVKVPEPPSLQGTVQDKNSGPGYLPAAGIAAPSSESKVLSAQVQKYTVEWFMIPAWLAGKWQKEGDLTVSLTDFKTGQQSSPNEWIDNKMQSTWGHQKDAAGNVWHVNLLPSERDGVSSGKLVRFLTNQQKCERTDQSTLVTRTHYIVSESNFYTGQPVDMFQQESINHYMAAGQDQVMNVSNNRVFTYEGKPVRDGQLHSRLSRIGQYVPTPVLNGVDLKASLNDFLEDQGLSNLMTGKQ